MANPVSGHHRSNSADATDEYHKKLAAAEAKALHLNYCDICLKVTDEMFARIDDANSVCSKSCMQKYYVRLMDDEQRKAVAKIQSIKESELVKRAEERKKAMRNRSVSSRVVVQQNTARGKDKRR